ncbi:MAG: ATP-dependent 6-phosphofructokinase [Deltaproteobacteria bacterium]|nr:ATP-dependent 6-phosphofructokinase [Deltaproteobacteria bacterium]
MIHDVEDTRVKALGHAKIPSPLSRDENFVSDEDGVMIDATLKNMRKVLESGSVSPCLEVAGPREKIYFDSSKLRCAIVTCGGLCPGLNDIIRSVVLELFFGYGVRNIYGIRYGLQGFIPKYNHEIVELSPASVANILELGGSILGSSRGPQDIDEIVDSLERMNVGILFMVGGDGTLKAATRIVDSITERELKISVVGIPKTIDNDIYLVARSFGFETAVDVATEAIKGAHNESIGYPNGVGLIKLMGRHSGFIAATATLAQQDVNFTLIPEVDFDIEGPGGLLAAIEERIAARSHAVIVVAEGAGQKFFENNARERDESGNIRLKDIGIFLKNRIAAYFSEKRIDISLKYIDPSYIIRSLPANANDHVFCSFLGRDAVHAGMAGKTGVLIGFWNNTYVHLPMILSAGKRKQVAPRGKLWSSVLEATGQGRLKND